MVWSGDNGDIKFPHRCPILLETHEKEIPLYDITREDALRRCCGTVDSLDMAYDVQAAQAATAGYFGIKINLMDLSPCEDY